MSSIAAEFTFAEQLLLNLAGPLLTAVVVGFLAAWITRKAQERRDDQVRSAQARREDHALRERLINEVTQAPTGLYLATQHYWRARRDELPAGELRVLREVLDTQYLESRRMGTVLEHLLGLHFPDPAPRRLMHRTMDLLTIRYFQLTREGGASESLRQQNAGDEHTGLSAEELRQPKLVLDRYHETLERLIDAVAKGDLQVSPRAGGFPAYRPPRP